MQQAMCRLRGQVKNLRYFWLFQELQHGRRGFRRFAARFGRGRVDRYHISRTWRTS